MKVIKKIFQFLVIIICIGVVIVLIYLGYILISNKLEERRLDNERTNSSNLMEYFKYHDFEHVHSSKKELYYIGENFVCDALNDHQVIAVDRDFMILDDYSIYQIILDQEKTFSNHQSCKKVETDIEILKIITFDNDEKLIAELKNKIKENTSDLAVASTFSNDIEISDIKAQKGLILAKAIKKMGIDKNEVIVLGDSFNDYSMFIEFENSYAMENAIPEIKEIAKYITDTNNNDGVAKAIYKCLDE